MAGNVNSIRTIIINGEEKEDNSFIQQYLFKLVPDFGVFDIAEKYFIDNNKTGIDKLFFYGKEIKDINFRRFIVKSALNISIDKITNEKTKTKAITITAKNKKMIIQTDGTKVEEKEYFEKDIIIGDYLYTVIIDECFKSGGFSVSSTNSNVIGVCF